MGRGTGKPLAMLEAALDAAREKPGTSASIAAAVSVLATVMLLSRNKVQRRTAVEALKW